MICHEYGMLGGGCGGGGGMQTSLLYVPTLGSDERQLYFQDKGGLTQDHTNYGLRVNFLLTHFKSMFTTSPISTTEWPYSLGKNTLQYLHAAF